MMNRPCYKGKPIASLDALSKALGIPVRRLIRTAKNAENLYRLGPVQIKSDGSKRKTLNAKWCLKEIQGRINKHIFEQVSFPVYLQGGIKDRSNPRDYIRNASMHVNAKTVINEDIASFFPSITREQIRQVWQYFFNFSPEVADCLTALTTHEGCLPQGARTSTYLANLVLWDIEPDIVARFEEKGVKYSRYVDDVSVSALQRLLAPDKQLILKALQKLCKHKCYKLKRKKHRIESASGPMHVHKLVVNKKVSLSQDQRARIRAAVHQLSNQHAHDSDSAEYLKEFNSVKGKVNNLARLHPNLGKEYKSVLENIQPPSRIA